MRARRRNAVCLVLIGAALANLLAYTVAYGVIGGDAPNGHTEAGGRYFIRGHFLKSSAGQEFEVSRGVWLYSYVHSISLWLSMGVVLLCMLVLARPHILATMPQHGASGPLTVWVLGLLMGLFCVIFAVMFVQNFVADLRIAAGAVPGG